VCLEDPVTGSLNASLAQWLIGAGLAPASYVAAQGHAALGRDGRVYVQQQGDTIWIGGDVVACIERHGGPVTALLSTTWWWRPRRWSRAWTGAKPRWA
jgi:hypothetical protein